MRLKKSTKTAEPSRTFWSITIATPRPAERAANMARAEFLLCTTSLPDNPRSRARRASRRGLSRGRVTIVRGMRR